MVKHPNVEIEYDLTKQRYNFTLEHNGKACATYIPVDSLGELADPDTWIRLIHFGWAARGMYDDQAQEPEGQPPSPA
jgi:hypothetical protein